MIAAVMLLASRVSADGQDARQPGQSPELSQVAAPGSQPRNRTIRPERSMSFIQNYERISKAGALTSQVPFRDPPEIHSGNGLLQATLVVNYAFNAIGGERVWLRSYNSGLVGPTWRVRAGDTLAIRLINDLPDEKAAMPANMNHPHGNNTTNLHTHGLHVSPEDNGDNPFLQVPPRGRQDYSIQIAAQHPPGTHWYHPHKHGSVAVQVCSGMAGALIVEGGLDEVAEIKAATEHILLFQQIPFSDTQNGTVVGTVESISAITGWPGGRQTTINGLLQPVIEMAPSEVQRWRLIHAGIGERMDLALRTVDDKPLPFFNEIANDGIALGDIFPRDPVSLAPGYRSDVLVKAPDRPGDYLIYDLRATAAKALRIGMVEPATVVARLHVCGKPRLMPLPTKAQLSGLAPYGPINSVVKSRSLDFDGADTTWTINKRQFNALRTDQCPLVNTAEEWKLHSSGDNHPFHIHVNPFQVLSMKDPQGNETLKCPVWKDTILLEEHWTIVFRTQFLDYPGKTVLHCHKLDHEDYGMMEMFRILAKCCDANAKASTAALENSLPDLGAAPPWRLPGADGDWHKLDDFRGRALLVALYRGKGCPHCVEQLRLISARQRELASAGISVVAIGTDSKAALIAARSDEPRQNGATSLMLLADEQRTVFKQYGCFTDHPLHGLFLIDRKGRKRWQAIGEDPFFDIESLVDQCRRLQTD
jgi:FtsP/CotA-like multicopper oxidase with cupredoxin domain/peroxiredoxin